MVARRARVPAPSGGSRVRGLTPAAGNRGQPGSAHFFRRRRRHGSPLAAWAWHRLPPYARSDLALRGASALIRELHSAATGFQPATTYRFDPRPPQLGEVVSHGDLGPWNTVYCGGVPVAFIDWDSAGPVDPLADLAAAAWTFVPLAPPEQLAEAGFDPLPDLPARLRAFVDAYRLADRMMILPELKRCMLDEPEQLGWLQGIATDLASAL